MLGYLVVAYLNNSFVITENKILVVNPNFPFRRFIRYDLGQIQKVKIDSSKRLWITMVFAHSGNNYIEITAAHKANKFYCSYLNVDAFDENFTENTMDDLYASLKQNNIITEFNLD